MVKNLVVLLFLLKFIFVLFFLGVVIGKTKMIFIVKSISLFYFSSKSLAPKYDELAKKLKKESSIVM